MTYAALQSLPLSARVAYNLLANDRPLEPSRWWSLAEGDRETVTVLLEAQGRRIDRDESTIRAKEV